ncbi:D-amino-acid transaminase [Paenibacillus radicis (ex Xue et al. 2023)]|uniref:D-alanine aminotransferase n=1 Tax=Paenibacillus radicis (ex Xue et al. 2023) TaxID=2972489 RepID=A0ABT1YDC8_9BACL|nr:D-amino-acid transaminase [Paenibacillus radicis (ex Xue et al. 2023)]MCR8631176.1 D-amino-acid transaminase [Paenibacillus radicis (ex Xue et al. 2023)]
MNLYLYQNQFLPKEQVSISPDDRGYYFGDGVYEVFRVYNGNLFEPEGHYRRLEKSAREVRIPLPYSLERLHQYLTELIQANHLQEGTVYMQITRGAAPRAHPFPPTHTEPVLMAFCNEIARPKSTMEQGITAITADDIRWLRCDLKTLNLLANVMAKQHALDQGAGEVILHRNGTITECSASNFMIIKEGELFTHPANNLILHGITREVVLRLARNLDIVYHERTFTIEDLLSAEEAFISGTTVEVTPIISVDGRRIGTGRPGPVTRKLQQAFEQLING